MANAMNSIRPFLSEKEKTKEIVDYFVSKAIEVEANGKSDQSYIEFYSEQLTSSASRNIDVIYNNSESPIETIFLNSLHLCFIKAAPLNVYFVPSYDDQLTYIDESSKYFALVDKRISDFKKTNPSGSMRDFILKAKSAYKKAEKKEMPADVLAELESYVHFARHFVHNYYHITPQAKLTNIGTDKVNMRLDLLIWVPKNPKIKFAVECDGYEWHQNKDSFTNDRQRDRILKSEGIEVFRFSGSEIYNKPQETASELFQHLNKVATENDLGPG